jgi:hypothetical protein
MVILEYPVQNQSGTPLHAFVVFALRRPQNVLFFKSFFELNVGELGLRFRPRPTLVTGVLTDLFSAVLD